MPTVPSLIAKPCQGSLPALPGQPKPAMVGVCWAEGSFGVGCLTWFSFLCLGSTAWCPGYPEQLIPQQGQEPCSGCGLSLSRGKEGLPAWPGLGGGDGEAPQELGAAPGAPGE